MRTSPRLSNWIQLYCDPQYISGYNQRWIVCALFIWFQTFIHTIVANLAPPNPCYNQLNESPTAMVTGKRQQSMYLASNRCLIGSSFYTSAYAAFIASYLWNKV